METIVNFATADAQQRLDSLHHTKECSVGRMKLRLWMRKGGLQVA
jgi:hypothetical protein